MKRVKMRHDRRYRYRLLAYNDPLSRNRQYPPRGAGLLGFIGRRAAELPRDMFCSNVRGRWRRLRMARPAAVLPLHELIARAAARGYP
jgi:hypothetical protein